MQIRYSYNIAYTICSFVSVISFSSLTVTLNSPFYSLGKMGAEWNKFPQVLQNAIQDQLAVCFREMTPQGNVILHLNYINIQVRNN